MIKEAADGNGGIYEAIAQSEVLSDIKQKNRLVYVLLALFFGFLGVHCYYAGNRIKALVLFILGVTTLLLTFFASLYFGLFCYFVLFIWSAFDAFSRDVDSEKMPFLDKMPAFRFGLTLTGFVILPLVAIATPIEYTRNPLRVFELDFEENLRIVRYCVKYHKRIIFPSTSEVYGMCEDPQFDEDNSKLVTGPIRMQRWIYSTCKQLLDRVIWAYGAKGLLEFTLFRPFNWIGPRLDSLNSARIGSSRAITQLILNLVQGAPIQLIDGGEQKRCFIDIREGVEALYRIIENKDNKCAGKIINIGNPANEASIREMAEMLVEKFDRHPLRSKFPPFAGFMVVESGAFYGKGYQDMQHRVPSIRNAKKFLDWEPQIQLEQSIETTLNFFLAEAIDSGEFNLD